MIVPILLVGLALILAYVGSRNELSKPQFLFVGVFLLAGATGVVFPDLSMRIAALFNVGRGADLLLYFSVLCGVLITAKFYFRFKETERRLIGIVRQLALLSPKIPCLQTPPSELLAQAADQPVLGRAWVVIPAFRESAVIVDVVSRVKSVCPRVVVVDDGSGDQTGASALAAGATVLTHVVNLGQGAALQTGIDFALAQGSPYIFTFDADGQHSPDALPMLAEVMVNQCPDVVLGSRWLGRVERMPWFRSVVLKTAVAFTRLHSGLAITDAHNGLRLLTRDAASKLRIRQSRMAHASEIMTQIAELKLNYVEAPVTIRYTEYSLRKGQRISGVFRVLLDIFYARWTK